MYRKFDPAWTQEADGVGCDAVSYVIRHEIPGDFVECGVWKGGSSKAVALWLQQLGRLDVPLHLFDTFDGMTAPIRKLEADIRAFIDRHNQNPRPFKWTKSADQILASVKRFCHKAQQTLCGEL